jgi:hypothetical protein
VRRVAGENSNFAKQIATSPQGWSVGEASHCQQLKKISAPFWRSRAKNRAFRCNSSAPAGLAGFPLQSLAPHGLTYALTCWQREASRPNRVLEQALPLQPRPSGAARLRAAKEGKTTDHTDGTGNRVGRKGIPPFRVASGISVFYFSAISVLGGSNCSQIAPSRMFFS